MPFVLLLFPEEHSMTMSLFATPLHSARPSNHIHVTFQAVAAADTGMGMDEGVVNHPVSSAAKVQMWLRKSLNEQALGTRMLALSHSGMLLRDHYHRCVYICIYIRGLSHIIDKQHPFHATAALFARALTDSKLHAKMMYEQCKPQHAAAGDRRS